MRFKLSSKILMKKLHWNQFIIALIVEILSISIYKIIQSMTPGKFDLGLPWDGIIPFWPSWIWIYLSVLPIFLFAALYVTPENFKTALRRAIIAYLITYPCFFIIPSNYPRPIIDPATFYGWGYGILHSIDATNNTFPSLHVSLTWIICHMLRRNGLPAWLAYGFATLISFSTLVTKQHFIIDIFGGLVIFLIVIAIEPTLTRWFNKWNKIILNKWFKKPKSA